MEEGRLLWRVVEICVRRMEISVTERVIAIEKHERLKYECEKCDDAFTTQNKLRDHEKLKHERVKCACYKCDDTFKTQNKLKNHKKLKPLVIQEGQDWSPTWWCWSRPVTSKKILAKYCLVRSSFLCSLLACRHHRLYSLATRRVFLCISMYFSSVTKNSVLAWYSQNF